MRRRRRPAPAGRLDGEGEEPRELATVIVWLRSLRQRPGYCTSQIVDRLRDER